MLFAMTWIVKGKGKVATNLVVAMFFILDRSLFAVSWLFGYVMPHLQKMLHALMNPTLSRPVGFAAIAFPVDGVFSTFFCAAGVHFFVGTEVAGVEAGGPCEDCNVGHLSPPLAPRGTAAFHFRPSVLDLQLGAWESCSAASLSG